MKTELYDYQKKIRDNIIESGDYSTGLFMKMGTGKTVTSLSVFEYLHEHNMCDKLLVVCLKCKINDWKNDIEKELGSQINLLNVEVINFESIWRVKRAEYYTNFVDDRTMIIVDESHKMKTYTSKVTKYLLSLYDKTKYKLILTGTPQSKQYIDYYPQMKFIKAQDFDIPYKQWEKTFVVKDLDSFNGRYFYIIKGYNFTDVLDKDIAQKAHYHEYLSKYDKPIEIYTDIEHSKDALKFQKERVWLDPDVERCDDVIADTPAALRTYMRQSCSGFIKGYDIESPKEEWLKEFLEIEPGRIVIFTNFIKEIEKVEEICKKCKRPVGVYYGARKDLEPFKNNSNGIAVVNYQSGAVGINDLCISNIGIFYGPPDGDHILMEQAKSRLDRIGQTKQPVFYYLQTIGSVEKSIYAELKQGRDFDNKQFLVWLEQNGGPFNGNLEKH